MTLRDLAKNFQIGTAVRHKPLEQDAKYANIIGSEFNLLVPESAMKCAWVCKEPHTYDFSAGDALVSFAESHNQTVRGHTLCWHLSYAPWMGNLTSLELEKVLRDYIFAMVERYKGKCSAWDVVNEAINDNGRARKSIWSQIEHFIQKCFLWAHEADPEAHLIYLDYRLHTLARWNAISKMIEELKDNNIPIHGIGLQLHHELFRSLAVSTIRLPDAVARFKKLGLGVHIGEVSITILPPTQHLPDAAKYELHALAYGKVMEVALNSGCESLNLWGFTDKHAYYKPPEQDNKGTPCIFDFNYQPKPAYFALKRELERFIAVDSG